jgi:hypothetical protein
MRLSASDLDEYVSRIAFQLERYGVALDLGADEAVVLDESPNGTLSLDLRGFLPDEGRPPLPELAVREKWRPVGSEIYERWEYEYELLDHERQVRRAFHLHDAESFLRRFSVTVHEHCERPIGQSPCEHFADLPIRDGYRAVEMLVDLWASPMLPDCATMTCLE